VSNTLSAAKESIVNFGSSISGWFRETLGINSPSKVFAALGAGIPEGAALGITGSQSLVRDAALGLATATAVTLAAPTLAAPVIERPDIQPVPAAYVQGAAAGNMGNAGNTVIHFSPTINITAAGDAQAQLQRAARETILELQRQIKQLAEREQRRGWHDMGVR